MQCSPKNGDVFRFTSGIRVIVSKPKMFEGELQVKVAQPRITLPDIIDIGEDGKPFRFPGVSWLPVSSITHQATIENKLLKWTLINTPLKKKRKKRK